MESEDRSSWPHCQWDGCLDKRTGERRKVHPNRTGRDLVCCGDRAERKRQAEFASRAVRNPAAGYYVTDGRYNYAHQTTTTTTTTT